MLPWRLAHVEAQQLAVSAQVARHYQLPQQDSLSAKKRNWPLFCPNYCKFEVLFVFKSMKNELSIEIST